MPELPEVEVTRLSVAPYIIGARIQAVGLGKPLRWPLGCLPEALEGRLIEAVQRRGKYLIFRMDTGLLLLHLGMSGSLSFFVNTPPPRGVHDHFEMRTTQGCLRLNDPRRFGAVVYASSEQDAVVLKLLGALGVEPLSPQFSVKSFADGLSQRRAAIKPVLLSGRVVVGVGNIYACEALFMAGIHPSTPACALSTRRITRLHQAIVDILGRSVALGGSTLRNFSNAQGQHGIFQEHTLVYGRERQACHTCGTHIQLLRQGQRSTYFCSFCQRP